MDFHVYPGAEASRFRSRQLQAFKQIYVHLLSSWALPSQALPGWRLLKKSAWKQSRENHIKLTRGVELRKVRVELVLEFQS